MEKFEDFIAKIGLIKVRPAGRIEFDWLKMMGYQPIRSIIVVIALNIVINALKIVFM